MLKTSFFVLAASFAAGAAAQGGNKPDPADPKTSAPAPRYDSAFKSYRPYAEPEVQRWRERNDEMGRLGGHVGHAQTAPAATGRTAPPAPPQRGHGSHK